MVYEVPESITTDWDGKTITVADVKAHGTKSHIWDTLKEESLFLASLRVRTNIAEVCSIQSAATKLAGFCGCCTHAPLVHRALTYFGTNVIARIASQVRLDGWRVLELTSCRLSITCFWLKVLLYQRGLPPVSFVIALDCIACCGYRSHVCWCVCKPLVVEC